MFKSEENNFMSTDFNFMMYQNYGNDWIFFLIGLDRMLLAEGVYREW